MMKNDTTLETPYGLVRCGESPTIYETLLAEIEAVCETANEAATVALTGGSTPTLFYQWAAVRGVPPVVRQKAVWTVSDERMVPLTDSESNFGNAVRGLLDPLAIPEEKRFPWPVTADPQSAGIAYEMKFRDRFGDRCAYDLCLLGMGEDGHTASIFPDSPLLAIDDRNWFSAVQVPGKGWRLSITPAGLPECGRIRVVVSGAAKADVLREVLFGPRQCYPVQLLERCAERVEWLVDPAAASRL
jgi:6-phosphogluconolactonase